MITKQQQQFVHNYAQTGNATQSAIEAGYSEKTATEQGSRLRKQLQKEISTEANDLLAGRVSRLLDMMYTIAEESPSDSSRIAAIKDLLDRAGYKPVEIIETSVSDLSSDERKQKINAILSKYTKH